MAQCKDSCEAGRWCQPMAVNFSFQRCACQRVSNCDCVIVLGRELIAGTRFSSLAAVMVVDGQFSQCLKPWLRWHSTKRVASACCSRMSCGMRGIKRNGALTKLLWYAQSNCARASTPPVGSISAVSRVRSLTLP